MPSTRRDLLAAAGTLGVTTLAGCSSPDLPPVQLASDPRPPDEATLVAAAEETLDPDAPYGAVRVRAQVYQATAGESRHLFLYSVHRLIPGQNQHANNGWLLERLVVDHEYAQAVRPVDTATNFAPAEDSGSTTARLGRTEAAASDGVQQWTLRFVDSGDASWRPRFHTEFAPLVTVTDGDHLGTVRAGVREATNWGLETHETGLAVDLRYGEIRT